MNTTPGGLSLREFTRDGGERVIASVRRRARDRPGSRLGADRCGGVAAGADRRRRAVRLVQRPVRLHRRRPPPGRGQRDRGAAGGPADDRVHLARARRVPGGKSARAERALILACAAASAYMNVSAADVASPRSVTAYAVAPIALAVVVDRVVAVIRRHVLADREPSAWITLGRVAAAAARIAGLVLLYCLRFALAAPQTARGLRRMVLDAAPLPALPRRPRPRRSSRPAPRKLSCSPCTAPTRTTGTAAKPAGSPPSWPRRRGCSRAPPAATCTPSWTAGHHDRRPGPLNPRPAL